MKLSIITTLLAIQAFAIVARGADLSGNFAAAQNSYEASDYANCLSLLNALDQQFGTSPRLESLRALSLHELNRDREAYDSLLVYTQLTAGLALADNPAHQDLIELRDALREELLAARKKAQQEINKDRLAKAETAAAETQHRLRAQQDQVAAVSSRRFYTLYSGGADTAALDASLKENLDPKVFQRLQSDLKPAAEAEAAEMWASLNNLLTTLAGRQLPYHLFPDDPASAAGPFQLQSIQFSGKTLDYAIIGQVGQPITLQEKTTVQGLDVSKMTGFASEHGPDDSVVFRLEFGRPVIWRRGSARFSDGKYFPGGVSSSSGSRTLSLRVPAQMENQVKEKMSAIAVAAKFATASRN